jgi:hypothetical protein
MVGMALLWAVISPSLVLAGSDDQSVASWLPFITKKSNDFRANLLALSTSWTTYKRYGRH